MIDIKRIFHFLSKNINAILLFALVLLSSCSRTDVSKEVKSLDHSAHAKDDAGNFAGAIDDCTRAIKLDPKSAESFYLRGGAMTGLNHFDAAINDFSEAIKLNPTDDDAYLRRGFAEEQIGDYTNAITDYGMAIKLNPKNLNDPYGSRGNLKLILKDYDGAVADFTKSIEFNPTNQTAYYSRGFTIYFRLHTDLAGAIADLDKAIELDPGHSISYGLRGILRRSSKNYSGAIDDYNKAIELDPKNGANYLLLALMQNDLSELRSALTNFNKAEKISSDPFILNRIELIRIQLGEQKEVTDEVMQFTNESAEFRHDKAQADALGKPLPFSNVVIDELLANLISESDFFQSATNSGVNSDVSQMAQKDRLCMAYYYAGMKRLIAEDKRGAMDLFQKCVDVGQVPYIQPGYFEYDSAEMKLNALKN